LGAGKHRSVDDRPFGGGRNGYHAGPVFDAVEAIQEKPPSRANLFCSRRPAND